MPAGPTPRRLSQFLTAAPFALVTCFGLWLLGPVARGTMPLSADHTVHLSRAWMIAQRLAQGQLSGWSELWSFGFPLGELYPPLGDFLVIGLHALGLGLLSWAGSYAFAFTLVFLLQGWVLLRLGRALNLGLIPGFIGALLILADPGFSREGGWMYTVYFGVWPQILATSLVWLGFAELAMPRRRSAVAVLGSASCFGGALLAHPMALLMLVIGAPLFVLCHGLRPDQEGRATRRGERLANLREQAARMLVALSLAAVLAAWWWLPMLSHKEWMASYGWLFASLSTMVHWLLEGHWAQRMPAAAGYTALIGVAWAALRGRAFARFCVAFAVVQWSLASTDFFWDLRLDRVSEGFTHLQYQRFIIAAKPGLFLAAGIPVAVLANSGWALIDARHPVAERPTTRQAPWLRPVRRALGVSLWIASAGLALWIASSTRDAMHKYEVGTLQLERLRGDPEFEVDYRDFLQWARDRWDARESDYRIAFRDARNTHWFMDSTPTTHTPLYKIGFTPGDNFVHKPESGRREVLDALGVRYLVRRSTKRGFFPREVARFGSIRVIEHDSAARVPMRTPARIILDDAGPHATPPEVHRLEGSVGEGRLLLEVRGIKANAEHHPVLVFSVAGYPRWRVSGSALADDHQEDRWNEAPVWGNAAPADVQRRHRGEFRGGRAKGDDGSEPTLISVPLARDGNIELRYAATPAHLWLARLLALGLALSMCILLAASRKNRRWAAATLIRFEAQIHVLSRYLSPLLLGLVGLTILFVAQDRWRNNAAAESLRAVGWMEKPSQASSVTFSEGTHLGPLKTNMLIRPAVLVSRKADSQVTFHNLTLDAKLTGWAALDDDQSKAPKRGAIVLSIDARPIDAPSDEWTALFTFALPHRADRKIIAIDTGALAGIKVDLRVRSQHSGKRAPRVGFDLNLGAAPQ